MKNFFIWIPLFILSAPFISMDRWIYSLLFSMFLYGIAYVDYKTYYISKYWNVVSIFFLLFQMGKPLLTLGSLLYGILGLFFYKKGWLGSADVYYLFYFEIFLGYERMCICIFISVCVGFLLYFIQRKKLIPYITCLSIGAWISYLKGYTLYSYLFYLI